MEQFYLAVFGCLGRIGRLWGRGGNLWSFLGGKFCLIGKLYLSFLCGHDDSLLRVVMRDFVGN